MIWRWMLIWMGVWVMPLGAENPERRPLPGMLKLADLVCPVDQDAGSRAFIDLGLREASRWKLNKYIFGSADPARGGMDCSGAVYYLLHQLGMKPPRTSAGMHEWVRDAGNLHVSEVGAEGGDHPSFDALRPGDLLFWAGTYQATDGRKSKVSHVQIYLGREVMGKQMMLGSTDGRSYQGVPRCGFGVYEFRLPRAGSKSVFVGYGRPPGLAQVVKDGGD